MKTISLALSQIDRATLTSAHATRSREPLLTLAKALVEHFETLLATDDQILAPQALYVSQLVNNATLVEYRSGALSSAREICECFISRALNRFDRDGDPRWLAAVFQPHVNIGRLLVLDGQLSEALRLFENCLSFCRGTDNWTLLSQKIHRRHAKAILAVSPDLVGIAVNVYGNDSIRSVLVMEDYEELERIVVKLEAEKDVLACGRAALEGRVRLLKERSSYKEALHASLKLWTICKKEPTPNLAVLSLVVDIYLATGDATSALNVLHRLAGLGARLEERNGNPHILQYTYYKMAQTFLGLGKLEIGSKMLLRAMRIASHQNAPATWIRLRCLGLESGLSEHELAIHSPSVESLEAEQHLPYYSERAVCDLFRRVYPSLPIPFAYSADSSKAGLSMGSIDDAKMASHLNSTEAFSSRDKVTAGRQVQRQRSSVHHLASTLLSGRL